jgi:hypothetical protein
MLLIRNQQSMRNFIIFNRPIHQSFGVFIINFHQKMARKWNASMFLAGETTAAREPYAVILLNTRDILPQSAHRWFSSIWNNGNHIIPYFYCSYILAELRVCADGGANYLHQISVLREDINRPHCICGDLDSVSDEALQYFTLAVR